MALSPTSPTCQPAASEPAYRRLHRAFFAFCIILAPLLVSGWFALCPQYAHEMRNEVLAGSEQA